MPAGRAAPGEGMHRPIPIATLTRISVPLKGGAGAKATVTPVSPPAGEEGGGFVEVSATRAA